MTTRIFLNGVGRSRAGFRGTPESRLPALRKRHQVALSQRIAEIHDPRQLAPTLQRVLERLSKTVELALADIERTLAGLLTPTVGYSRKFTTVAAATTLGPSHDVLLVDATSGALTITLPAVSGSGERQYVIKKIDSSGNAVTVDGNASETIDGATTSVLSSQYDTVRVGCDGSAWWTL